MDKANRERKRLEEANDKVDVVNNELALNGLPLRPYLRMEDLPKTQYRKTNLDMNGKLLQLKVFYWFLTVLVSIS